jgi:DNA-binding NtrC family response regulator
MPRWRNRAESVAKHRAYEAIGKSPIFQRVQSLIKKLAAYDATLLIDGETGTGKELAARTIHYSSKRSDGPFIPINCGAITDSLVECELFGAERGAFTDARESRPGIVSQATGGTLMLDEVEVMTPRAQVALLRFLENHEYRPVGGKPCQADVRIIAATNRSLTEMVAEGSFRKDLLFRLNLTTLQLPPLRDRGKDVLLLAESFNQRYAEEYQQPLRILHPKTITTFLNYHWPGNIRELENLIHRQYLTSDDSVIHIENMSLMANQQQYSQHHVHDLHDDFKTAKARAIDHFEKSYLTNLLHKTGGNISRAAMLSGKERSALGKMMKKHGLNRAEFKY